MKFIPYIIQLRPMVFVFEIYVTEVMKLVFFFLVERRESVVFEKQIVKSFCVNHEGKCRKSVMLLKLFSCSFVQFTKKLIQKLF